MANSSLSSAALAKPPKGSAAKAKRSRARLQAEKDKWVYALVDVRDGFRCRACAAYAGLDVHRHHLIGRSSTTLQTVCHVCPGCHERLHVRVGGKTLKLYGNADQRNRFNVLNGLTAEWLEASGTWRKESGL